jgi:hypothetical protein
MIGANREAVTRALGDLRRGGVIEIRERRIHVADIEALRRAARPRCETAIHSPECVNRSVLRIFALRGSQKFSARHVSLVV